MLELTCLLQNTLFKQVKRDALVSNLWWWVISWRFCR